MHITDILVVMFVMLTSAFLVIVEIIRVAKIVKN